MAHGAERARSSTNDAGGYRVGSAVIAFRIDSVITIKRCVRYRLTDLEAWAAANEVGALAGARNPVRFSGDLLAR